MKLESIETNVICTLYILHETIIPKRCIKPSGKERSVKNGYSSISGPSLDIAVFGGNFVGAAKKGVVVNGVGCEVTEETRNKKRRRSI